MTLKQTLDLQKKHNPIDPIEVSLTLQEIAQLYRHEAKFKLALDSYAEALKFLKQTTSVDNCLAQILNGMSGLYVSLDKYDLAAAKLEESLTIQKKILPLDPTK